ncbi:MAG: hypothetical protein N2323_00575, partial [candidate division WOR-3 bacterium]|nr:hypothetical protein [candidate division WOR-3 bacterium]
NSVPVDSFVHSLWGDKEIPIFLYFKFKNFPISLKIDWGDGKIESLEVKWIIYEAEHKYEKPGKYVIKIKIGKDYFISTDTVTIFEEIFIGKINLEDMVYGSCAIDKEENLYIGDVKGNFYSFNLLGQKRFKFSTEGEIYGSPIVVDTLVYFGADSFLYCLTKNGKLVFKNKLSGKIYNTPAFLAPDKIAVASDDGNLYIFSLLGKKIREIKFPAELSDISVDEKNNLIFSCGAHIYSLNSKGKINFKFHSLEEEDFFPPPIITRDYIICGCEDGYLYFLDKKKGRLIKRVATFDEDGIKGEPVIDEEGKIYFGDDGGKFYVYDGRLISLFEAEDGIISSPLIIKKDNKKIIFFLDEMGYLYALNEKGNVLFKIEISSTDKDLYQTPSFLFVKEKLIIPSWDGYLYAFRIEGELIKSEWYTYRANFFRNGKINRN